MTMKKTMIAGAVGALLAFGAGGALAAAPDWGKVDAKEITLFYPGVSPLEWIQKGTEHGGARALRKGETCADCHSDEAADMGKKIASGQKLEPNPIPGKAPFIPVTVQAAHDGENLYLRFSWKQPAASGAPKMDEANPVKIAFMLESGGKVELADQSGCWATCHQDSRTMPGADDAKKKYVKGGSLADGKFYDLYQWRSGENKGFNGHVADTRVMEGGAALVSAEGKQDGDAWAVVFTRKLTGGEGDVTLEAGKSYNFGFAIHNDNAAGRYHHVSLGYKLGIDAEGDVKAAKH
ncbi:ethylbenzene dehydrogenase-related protein [Thauera sp. WH-1]|uniref:ethylbenzene dehydrogenase-related protein n=1 Tax=Thauera sp. WH-1 TaxID=3398230 RepID=UPI0039FBB566